MQCSYGGGRQRRWTSERSAAARWRLQELSLVLVKVTRPCPSTAQTEERLRNSQLAAIFCNLTQIVLECCDSNRNRDSSYSRAIQLQEKYAIRFASLDLRLVSYRMNRIAILVILTTMVEGWSKMRLVICQTEEEKL